MKFLLNAVLCSILFTFSAQFQIIKIGAIFFRDEFDLVNAFDTAINDINHLESDIGLEAVKHFLTTDDSIDIQQLACDLFEKGVAAIFGPSSKASSNIVEILCNITGIPHLQYDWHAYDLELQRRNHQMTINVAPAEIMISTAYWDILRSSDFDWKSFTIVYESSAGGLTRMQHILAWKNLHKTAIRMKAFERGEDYRILWKYISSTREKFVLLDCSPDILKDVVNASIYYNMTGQFNKLFLTNLNTHLSDIKELYSKDFTASTMAVRLRSFVPPEIHSEMDVFEDVEQDKIIALNTQLLYDAVVLYFNAVRNTIHLKGYKHPHVSCEKGYWQLGQHVLAEMKTLTPRNITPHYKTQKLHINENGLRDDFNLEIYNPMIERVSHVWNVGHQVVSYDMIVENATKKAQKSQKDDKEDFSQKRVRYTVATKEGEPYFMWRPEPEGVHYEGNERFEGYAVDLIYKLAEECKFDFVFEPVADNKYGSYDPLTDEWDGIIRQLMDNNAQLGICDLTITQARRTVVDFTVPFMQLGVSILYSKPAPPPKNLFGFLKPYSLEVWIYLLICLMVVAFIAVLVARLSQSEWEHLLENDPNVVENKWHLVNSFWLMIGSILNAGCDILPRASGPRFLTTFWWVFALLLSQTYIAKLASFITSAKLESSISNLHDLIDQNKVQFGTVKGGSTSLLFSESNESDYRMAWNKMRAMKPDAFTKDNKEGVDRVKRSRGRYAFLMETTNLQYFVQRNCDLTQIGEPFGEKHYGIAVPLNFPLRSNLSVGILKLSEKGVLYTLKNKWFNKNDTECAFKNVVGIDDSSKFTMESLGGLFIVLVAGIFASALIAICEFLWNVERIAVKEHVSAKLVLKAELKFFICFWLDRKPLRTYMQSRDSTSTGYSSCSQSSSTSTVKKKKKGLKKKLTKCL